MTPFLCDRPLQIVTVVGDITQADTIHDIVDRNITQFERLDVLVSANYFTLSVCYPLYYNTHNRTAHKFVNKQIYINFLAHAGTS